MAMTLRAKFLIPILCLVAALVSCGSDAVDSSTVDLSVAVSEQDLDSARTAFAAASDLWDGERHSDYTLQVGIETLSKVEFTVVGGTVESTKVLLSDADVEGLPQTVEELFEQVDLMISELEDDPSKVPPEGECGWHFNIRFDPELGYPSYYDGLGPCDDGVGISASVELAE